MWICRYCGRSNKAVYEVCNGCGAPPPRLRNATAKDKPKSPFRRQETSTDKVWM